MRDAGPDVIHFERGLKRASNPRIQRFRMCDHRASFRPRAGDAGLDEGRTHGSDRPLPTVNEVAVPIAVPLVFKNAIVPVQEAAVPLDDADAVLTTLICTVSELARPTGGVFEVCVTVTLVVVVYAEANATVADGRRSLRS